jgi:hypothetical protein
METRVKAGREVVDAASVPVILVRGVAHADQSATEVRAAEAPTA